MLNFELKDEEMINFGCRISDCGGRISDFGGRIADFGCRIANREREEEENRRIK